MITAYDYLSLAFYFLFIVAVGIAFSRRSKDTSDYFRAGGKLPWWLTGASAWMAGFTAWSFTGAAGKMFQTGAYTLLLFYSILIPLIILLVFTCYRFRRMQVLTPFEAVRLRFGKNSQVFFTWARLPFMVIFGGVTLNAVAVFMSAVSAFPTTTNILIIGTIITLLALFGGSFAVVASDFVQMLLIVAVTTLVAILALNQPDIGGLSGLIEKAPAAHKDWTQFSRPQFIILWFLAFMLTKTFEENSIDKSAKYLMCRSDRQARMTLIIPIIGVLVTPLIWLVPPTVAAIRHGEDIATIFTSLRFPEEGAFVLTASEVLPNGMMGLLLCGIVAATLSSMDAGLNQGAGIFVRNFYLPIFNPDCPEKKLLQISKITTGIIGLIMITSAMAWETMRELSLFDLLNQVAIGLGLPMAIPLFLGLFWRRTPPWAAWSTVLIGLAGSFLVKFVLTPSALSWLPGMEGPFMPEEVHSFTIFSSVLIVSSLCTAWFFATSFFYDTSDTKYMSQLDDFFGRLHTPIVDAPTASDPTDRAVSRTIAKLCLAYGIFVTSLVLIPNPAWGRLCFIGCGGLILVIGAILWFSYRSRVDPTQT